MTDSWSYVRMESPEEGSLPSVGLRAYIMAWLWTANRRRSAPGAVSS